MFELGKIKTKKNIIDSFVFILLIMQPILDVLSFFMIQSEMTAITTVLRMLIFAGIALYAFWITDQKKAYIIMGAVLAVFWIFHMIGCYLDGYQSVYQDLAMYIRTIQMPVLTLCFITFFKRGNDIPKVVRHAFLGNYIIIMGVILLSYIVGMPESTYQTGIGVKGWFYVGNSQSCIIALMAPIVICFAVNLAKEKRIFILLILIPFLNLYFFGTKVAYYTIYITIISMIFFMVINKIRNRMAYIFLIICFLAAGLLYGYSPSYQNQYLMGISMEEWDEDIAALDKENSGEEEEINYEDYREIYSLYTEELVERFGLERVVNQYHFSKSAQDLVDNRNLKINYSSLVMDEKSDLIHLFGFEYMDYIYNGNIYDPENDFPAIYFSNGIVGLGLYLAFILYFFVLILKKVFSNTFKFWKNITLESGAVGTTLLLILGSAQLSGNVLRRPNVSIYLSLILAYVYYICVIKDKKGQNGDNYKRED